MELNLFSYIRPNTKGKQSTSMSGNVLNTQKGLKGEIILIVLSCIIQLIWIPQFF